MRVVAEKSAPSRPKQPSVYREAARHLAHSAQRLLRWGGALAAALSLVLAVAAWRLAQGPVALDFLAPYVEAALDRAGIGIDVTLSGMRLGIDLPAHRVDLRADNVRLAAPDGTRLASLPQTAMSLALGPLLQGRVEPTSLIVEKPVVHLRRDAGGAVSIDLAPSEPGADSAGPVALDRLLRPAEGDPAAALPRRVAIRGATVLIDDEGSGLTWRADPVDIAIERGPDRISGDISLAMPLGASRPELRAVFRYAAASRNLDLDLSLDGVLPADLPAPVPELAPLRQVEAALSGRLQMRIDLDAVTAEAARLDIAIGNGRLRSELLPNGGIAIGGGELRAVYDPEGRELRLDTLRLDLGGGGELAIAAVMPGIAAERIAAAIEGRPHAPVKAGVTATLKHIPAARLGELWPALFSPGGRRWVLANVHDGVLDEASVQLAIDLDPAARTAVVAQASGTLRYRDVTATYLKGLEPVRKVGGRAVFDSDRLEFTPTEGWLRGLRVTGGALLLTELGQDVEWLTVDLPVAGPLRDVLDIIDAKPLGYARDIGVDPAKVTGQVETRLHFRLPLLDALKLAQVEYKVEARLAGVGIAGAALDRDISDGDFALAIDKPGARLHGTARFADVPVRLDSELLFHVKKGPRARYRVAASLDDTARRRLGIEIAPERFGGPVAIDARYTEFAGNRGEADILLDLRDAALGLPETGWKKLPGSAGTARVILDLDNDGISRVRRIDAQAPGLHAVLSGRFTADGKTVEQIDIHRLTLGDSDLAGTVVRRPAGGWRADIHAAVLDAGHLLKDSGGAAAIRSDAADRLPPLAVNTRIGRLLLGPRRELRQVAASLLWDGGDWRSAQIDAQYAGGGALWLRLGEESGGQPVMVQSDDLGAMLKLLDITDTVEGGRLRMDGQLMREDGKQVLRAHLEGKDYTVKNSSTALRVLSLPSLTGIASALSGSGLPFSTLRGDLIYRDGVVSIENALAYGESIGVTAAGWIDTERDRMQLNGTLAPAYALNSLPGKVPVIGAALGGSQGLFAADFQLSGAASDPEVAVNPLSILTPGGLRTLFAPLVGFPEPQQVGRTG
ncbi:MAG: AsmA-like C-terminal domain-containing protein [Alphaproteobacteria bacterium]